MSLRGHIPPPLEGRPIQAPGMMRHGPFPSIASINHHHHPLDSVPQPPPPLAAAPTILEEKVAVQAAEMERLTIENQRLAASHVTLRQELVSTEREMQMLQAQMASIHTESDIHIRALLEKIGKMEADIRVGDLLEKELRQAHMEAQSLFSAKEELMVEIRQVTEELQSTDRKNLPEMCTELDALRQEHQKLRTAFEYEKGSNIKQVEQMQSMEKNLISMAREVEKLRVEVLNAEKRSQGANSYRGPFTSPGLAYPAIGQSGGNPSDSFVQSGGYNVGVSYGHSGSYSVSTFVSGGPPFYVDSYGISQNPTSSGAAAEITNIYNGSTAIVYSDGYGRQSIPVINATTTGEGFNTYGGTNVATSYDPTRGAPSSTNG